LRHAGALAEVPEASRRELARERAIGFLKAQNLAERRMADHGAVGIQATIATGGGSAESLDLYSVLDGTLPYASTDRNGIVADMVERKLGSRLEPELFSNMLFAAQLGADPHPEGDPRGDPGRLRDDAGRCLAPS
jgi:hypothetical protein